jgi:phospholipid-translocating P-type ATPase (flippase)
MRRVHLNEAHLELPDNTVSNTKYTRWNFAIKTLVQQFSKPMNLYFLLIAILQLDSSLTPVNPLSTWGPLCIITLVSMLKEYLDDRKRAESDRIVNERAFAVVQPNGRVQHVRAAQIRVGQLVLVRRDDEVPCDLLLVRTSEDEGLGMGTCYVQTTNLDGEADLKLRRAPARTQAAPRERLHELRGTIECAQPNANLREFHSTLVLQGAEGAQRLGLSVEQLLLQATRLRKTEWVVGVAVYTGSESKVGCNKSPPSFKYPAAEQAVNRFAVAIFCGQLLLALVLGVRGTIWRAQGEHLPYLGGLASHTGAAATKVAYEIAIPLRFLLLMSIMIPISLAVTLDLLRWIYALWIREDTHMHCERTGLPALANSTAVPEDLGQVRYIFSDKTGTLTENQMLFRAASIGGVPFGSADGPPSAALVGVLPLGGGDDCPAADAPPLVCVASNDGGGSLSRARAGQADMVLDFWRCVSLCNTCLPTRSSARTAALDAAVGSGGSGGDGGGDFEYASSSADEEALCLAAQRFGVALASRTACGLTELELRAPWSDALPASQELGSGSARAAPLDASGAHAPAVREAWECLHTIDFTSERKRMSVIARREGSGQVVLFCKGADEVMWPLFASASTDPLQIGARTARHVRRFAQLGLRTLVMGSRQLEAQEYAAWAAMLAEAQTLSAGRQEAIDALFAAVECGLQPLGASAIEDALQPGVRETVRALLDARVRVWMLTGDKAETALEVARASGLVPHSAYVVEPQLPAHAPGCNGHAPACTPPPPGGAAACRADDERETLTAIRELSGMSTESAAADDEDAAIPDLVLRALVPSQLQQCMLQHRAALFAGSYGPTTAADADADESSNGEGNGAHAYALMLEGGALTLALDDACRSEFCQLALGASAVICARATPGEKAQVVRLVKEATARAPGPAVRVLAVGDGGNDVAMIQEAHVGVGIAGKEGMQAARAADYTIGRFRFLQRLLLVHGHRAHKRTAAICLYTLYKSIFFALIQVLFNPHACYSGVSFFPSVAVTVWNAPFTMLTGFSLLLDRDVSDASLLAYPRLYTETQQSLDLNASRFGGYCVRAVAQAVLCFWATMSAFGTTEYAHPASGAASELQATGYIGFTVALYVQVLTVYVEQQSFVCANHVACAGCLLGFHLSFWLYSLLPMSGDDRGIIAYIYADPAYWLGSVTIACAAVLPVALVKYALQHAWPAEATIVQYLERMSQKQDAPRAFSR